MITFIKWNINLLKLSFKTTIWFIGVYLIIIKALIDISIIFVEWLVNFINMKMRCKHEK